MYQYTHLMLLYYLFRLFIISSKNDCFLFALSASFEAKADAKIRTLSYILQMFLKFFLNFILANLSVIMSMLSLVSLTKRVQKYSL